METFDLAVWTFKKGKASHSVTATYPMTEPQARAAAAKRGWDVEGWADKQSTQPVKVAGEGDGKKYLYTVTFERTQTMEVEVDAGDEDEARELAEKEAKDSSSYDWDDDDTMEITDVEKGECVDDDEESVG